jgi:hypothetical protein
MTRWYISSWNGQARITFLSRQQVLPLVFLVGLLFRVVPTGADSLLVLVVPDVVMGVGVIVSAPDTILCKGSSATTTTTTTTSSNTAGTKRIKSRIVIDNFHLPHIHRRVVGGNDGGRFQLSYLLFLILLLLILLIPLI